MCETAHSFYSELYTPEEVDNTAQEDLLNLIDNKFNENSRNTLNADLTVEEINAALDTMSNNKSPGPDGLTAAFYKQFREILAPILLAAFKEAFASEEFSAELSAGQIILLYKKEDLTLMKNYRLITLLNTDYKIITKALARRFSKVLTEVVGPFQHAFIPGRRASDCAMALNLIIEKLRLNNESGIILSLDIEKAYNRVHHE
jgi:hypothetical protein